MTKLSPDLAAMARKNEQKILNLLVERQKELIAMRSPDVVAQMEREKGLV